VASAGHLERVGRLGRVAGIYAIADDDAARRQHPRAVVAAAIAAGIRVIQLRLKHTSDRDAIALARELLPQIHAADALLIVNDRLDIADLAGADGVHLGADDLPPEQIPPSVRRRLIVGLSTHTPEQVELSRGRPVDYIGFGPVFGTVSKESEYSPRGLDALAHAVARARHPVVAIGGIDIERVLQVARTGAAAAAVIGAIAQSERPQDAAGALRVAFEAGVRARTPRALITPRVRRPPPEVR
jgi:thiamine-phosphate pyrophosphorylase